MKDHRHGHVRVRDAGRGLGTSIFGWAVFAVLFTVISIFGYKTWTYVKLLRRGQAVSLPQFAASLSVSGSAPSVSSSYIDPKTIEGGDEPTLGNTTSPQLTIVEFADFQCPYSKEAYSVVRQMAAKYGDRVRVIYRDFPLETLHPNAFQAAEAAECAKEQGKFWAYHDKLYANSPALGFNNLLQYAQQIGLDEKQFQNCLVGGRYKDRVTQDLNLAKSIGLRGTPTFFFNGQKVEGSIPVKDFQQIIERMLK